MKEQNRRAERFVKLGHAALVVQGAIGPRGMRVEAKDFEIDRVNLLPSSFVAVGAKAPVDRNVIADIHLVGEEGADFRIERESGQIVRALFLSPDFWSVQNSSTATLTTVFAALPANCRGFCETLPDRMKMLREVIDGSEAMAHVLI